MAIIYVMACLFIILSNFSYIDDAFGLIFLNAFSMHAPKAFKISTFSLDLHFYHFLRYFNLEIETDKA